MPRLIKKCQRQKLVYWPYESDNAHGEPIWGAAQEMTCRWDDVVSEIIDPQGTVVYSKASIISEIYLNVGGLVRKGTLDETPNTGCDPKDNGQTYEIIKVSATPDIKNRRVLYEAWV